MDRMLFHSRKPAMLFITDDPGQLIAAALRSAREASTRLADIRLVDCAAILIDEVKELARAECSTCK